MNQSLYRDDQIGSRISSDYIVIRRGSTVKEAMKELVAQAAVYENLLTIYVERDDGRFYGAIPLQKLIAARSEDSLNSITDTLYPYVRATEDIAEATRKIRAIKEDSIPVLSESKRIVGVITAQDLVDVIDDEMSEDYAKLAGLSDEEDLHEPVFTSMKKRLPWLVVLLFLGMLVSSVVGLFEAVVAEITVVMLFQSLILDMSGNVGTQSLAVTIRVLMDENLQAKDKLKLVFKEGRVALFNGLLLGVAAVGFAGVYLHFAKAQTWSFSFSVSLCIGLALMIAMLISGIVGTLVPMFFKKIHVDPAVASGPLITTVNDLVAVVTYYGLVYLLLIQGFGL